MSSSDNDAGWLVFLGIAVIVWGWSAGWFDQPWYALRYSLSLEKVHIDHKPKDCDFDSAPLGNKGCHYKEVLGAYNAAGELVGGDGAPEYSHDVTSHRPIISWDDGKTWQWVDTPDIPNPKVESVNVSWVKVTD